MQKGIWQDEHLKSYKNSFCDSEKSAVLEFNNLSSSLKAFDDGLNFDKKQILELNRYAVLKNLLADCKDLVLHSICPDLAYRALKEYGMNGTVLIDANLLLGVKEYAFADEKIRQAYYIDSLLSFNESQLSLIAQKIGQQKAEVYINFYRTLEEAGKIDNLYAKSPARVLEDFGLLDRSCNLVGCNFLDKDDARIVASYKAKVILTPLADMLLGRGAVNMASLYSLGIDVKLGSGEYPYADMLQEGRLARGNTANLMYDPFAVTKQQIEDAIASPLDVDEMLTQVRFDNQRQTVTKIFKGMKK